MTSSPSPFDSFESRLREMAADRLLETVQFTKSKEESVECGSATALLLSMAQTLRACMRDWPTMEDNASASAERTEAMNELKRTLKEARRLTRSTPLDSLVFVCCDALFLVAEQWPAAREKAEEENLTYPKRKSEGSSSTVYQPTDDDVISPKRARFDGSMKETSRPANQYFPPYPEDEDDDEQNDSGGTGGGQEIDPLMFFNQSLNGLIKEEDTDLLNGNGTMGQAEADIWSTQNPLAAFAAVTSSTSHQSHGREDSERSRIRNNRFNCPECGIGCFAKSQLDAHMNVHTGNRPFQCNFCEKNYKRKDHLSDHLKKNHPNEHAAARQKKDEMKNKSSSSSSQQKIINGMPI